MSSRIYEPDPFATEMPFLMSEYQREADEFRRARQVAQQAAHLRPALGRLLTSMLAVLHVRGIAFRGFL
jgi:hypothetical protein